MTQHPTNVLPINYSAQKSKQGGNFDFEYTKLSGDDFYDEK